MAPIHPVHSMEEMFNVIEGFLKEENELTYTRLSQELNISAALSQRVLATYADGAEGVGCSMLISLRVSPVTVRHQEVNERELADLLSSIPSERIESICVLSVWRNPRLDHSGLWRSEMQYTLSQLKDPRTNQHVWIPQYVSFPWTLDPQSLLRICTPSGLAKESVSLLTTSQLNPSNKKKNVESANSSPSPQVILSSSAVSYSLLKPSPYLASSLVKPSPSSFASASPSLSSAAMSAAALTASKEQQVPSCAPLRQSPFVGCTPNKRQASHPSLASRSKGPSKWFTPAPPTEVLLLPRTNTVAPLTVSPGVNIDASTAAASVTPHPKSSASNETGVIKRPSLIQSFSLHATEPSSDPTDRMIVHPTIDTPGPCNSSPPNTGSSSVNVSRNDGNASLSPCRKKRKQLMKDSSKKRKQLVKDSSSDDDRDVEQQPQTSTSASSRSRMDPVKKKQCKEVNRREQECKLPMNSHVDEFESTESQSNKILANKLFDDEEDTNFLNFNDENVQMCTVRKTVEVEKISRKQKYTIVDTVSEVHEFPQPVASRSNSKNNLGRREEQVHPHVGTRQQLTVESAIKKRQPSLLQFFSVKSNKEA